MAEKEYIEREKVLALQTDLHFDNIEQLKHWKCRHIDPTDVELLPAADVQPVVRGRWIRHYEQADTGEDIITYPCGWVCSECGRWEPEDEPFCNCGADMREES